MHLFSQQLEGIQKRGTKPRRFRNGDWTDWEGSHTWMIVAKAGYL